jgi:hypothetical protein
MASVLAETMSLCQDAATTATLGGLGSALAAGARLQEHEEV